MNRYKVIVEGGNFLLPLNSRIKTVGFFSTFIIRSKDASAISKDLEPVIHSRLKENHLELKNGLFSVSRVIVEAVYSLDSSEPIDKVDGFSFYKMTTFSRLSFAIKAAYVKMFFPRRLIVINDGKERLL